MHPSTRPILSIAQSTPLARPKMILQTRQAPAMTQPTSVQTLKTTTLYVISVFKLTKPDSVKPNKLTTWCSGKLMLQVLVKKFLTASDAPHLDTKAFIQKFDQVAKTVHLDVSTILAEQMKDPVLGTVRSWIRENTPPDTKSPEIQLSKGLLRYRQEFRRLLIEDEGQLSCYNEPSDKLEKENLRICLPLSLFLACF